MENVQGITTLDDGSFLKALIIEIEKLGYKNHDYKIINTADYGVPQKRKRFILIANRTGNIIPWPKPKYYDNPEDWQKQYRSVGEVLLGLETKKSQETKNEETSKSQETTNKSIQAQKAVKPAIPPIVPPIEQSQTTKYMIISGVIAFICILLIGVFIMVIMKKKPIDKSKGTETQ